LLIRTRGAYHRRIGFSEFPETGSKYLRRLAEIYDDELARAKAYALLDYKVPDRPFGIFMDSYHHTGDILADHGGDSGSHLVNRMVFAQQVAALEAYLSDSLINATTRDDATIKRLLATDKDLVKEKYSLTEIAANPDFVRTRVRLYLQSLSYHNLAKVEMLYRNSLDIELFPSSSDRSRLYTAIAYRHDCVHRNGIDKDGKKLEVFTKEYVQSIADTARAVVERIEACLATNNQFPRKAASP
jgi:hypothetical protein